MQRTIFIFFFAICFCNLYAEVEPNNTVAQANTLSFGGYYIDNDLDPAADVDWWKITTYTFGKISLIVNSVNGTNVNFELYNANGTTLLASGTTSSTATLLSDNLNAGTYTIKLYGYTPGKLTTYTLFASFLQTFLETEPNNTFQDADFVSINNMYQGHINNLQTDTVDWYKMKILKDGRLRIHIAPPSGLALSVSYYYLEIDKLILMGSYVASSETDIDQNGMGKKTGSYYYLKISVANLTDTISGNYTFDFSLFSSFTDFEPNNTPAYANLLTTGSTTVGHLNYYTTNDTVDWYKITTENDGDLQFVMHPHQGHTISALLYGSDAATIIDSATSNSLSITLKAYGLAKGTYYYCLRSPNNTGEWQNYTFTNHLLIYTTPDDYKYEPNNLFSQAAVIPANGAAKGHINFYDQNIDSIDIWKINYTGTGNIKLNLSLENREFSDSSGPVLFQVYKETYKPPLYSNYISTTSGDINLTGLSTGDYFIKLTGTNKQANAYTVTDSFTQTKVDFKITDKSTKVVCAALNYIKAKCLGSHPPYIVKRYYRNQEVSNDLLSNSLPITYSNIQGGVYKFVAYAEGATGNAIDTEIVFFLPVPVTLTAYNITGTTATIEWNRPGCNGYYSIRYRATGTTTWTMHETEGNDYFYNISNLLPNTTYEWQIAPGDSAYGVSGLSSYSVLDSFTTASSFASIMQQENFSAKNKNDHYVIAYPNPARSQFIIHYNPAGETQMVSLSLKNINGTLVWNKNNIYANTANGTKVDVGNLSAGIYVLSINDKNNNLIAIKKIVVVK